MTTNHSAAAGGFNLPAARQAHNLTQARLATLLGVTVTTVSRWERAGASPAWLATWFQGYASSTVPLANLDRTTLPTI